MSGQARRFRALGRAHPLILVRMFAGVFRLEWGEVFELHVVSWIDLRLIVDGSGVTSFVFTFDAFVCDVDVMEERFVVIFRKWGSARKTCGPRGGGLGTGPELLAQNLEVAVA